MGATKRVPEMNRADAAVRHRRNFVSVRFGNCWHRCSVVPIFPGQIRAGGPLTITIPRCAATHDHPRGGQTVLQAVPWARRRRVFVLDMGEASASWISPRICSALGLEVGRDIEIAIPASVPASGCSRSRSYRHVEVLPQGIPSVRATNITCPGRDPAVQSLVTARAGMPLGRELRHL